jgi:hypothetical protein
MGFAAIAAMVPAWPAKLGAAKGSANPRVFPRVLIMQFAVGLSAQPTIVRRTMTFYHMNINPSKKYPSRMQLGGSDRRPGEVEKRKNAPWHIGHAC